MVLVYLYTNIIIRVYWKYMFICIESIHILVHLYDYTHIYNIFICKDTYIYSSIYTRWYMFPFLFFLYAVGGWAVGREWSGASALPQLRDQRAELVHVVQARLTICSD